VTCQGLAAYIAEQSDRILSRWCEEVSRDPDQPANRHHLSGRQLVDHLPLLLDALTRCLRDEDVGEVEQHGREHGHQRRSVGYRVEELLDEMHLFRRVVFVTVDEHRRERMDDGAWVAARSVILDLLERSITASVAEYTRETESERDLARARLEQRNVELRDANAQKDRFLTVLSHELRNPLSPILSAVHVLRRLGVQDANFERQRAIIERQATHMSKLVNDLLDVNRIAHGKIELQPEVVDLRDSVRHAAELPAGNRRPPRLARHRPARRAAARLCRPDAARPSGDQPAGQRRQVHRIGRSRDGARAQG
jgi:signal transduction histidine kinase